MELEAGDSATGGAAAASAAALQRMRENPPPSLGVPAEGDQDGDEGRTPAVAAEDTEGRTPAEEARPESSKQAKADEPKKGKFVSTAVLEGEGGESAYDRLLKSHNGDTEALAKAVFDTNKRMSDLTAQLKGETVDEDTEGATLEVEAAPVKIDQKAIDRAVSEALGEFVRTDADMVSWDNKYRAERTEAETLLTHNADGEIVGGQLVTIARQLETLNAKLDPKAHGLEDTLDTPDAVEADQLRTKITLLEAKQATLETRHGRHIDRMAKLEGAYNARLERQTNAQREHFEQQATEKASEVSPAALESAYLKEWNTEFNKRTEGLSKEDKDFLRTELSAIGTRLTKRGGDVAKFGPWMDEELPALKERISRKSATEKKTAAVQRRDAAQTRVPAGNENTTAAVPAERTGSSRDARRAADRRVGLLTRSVQLR